jgi:hypothetical protein
MRHMGIPELLIFLLILASLVAPVWISQKAKPLGPLPYKWGTFIGIQSGLLGIGLLIAAIVDLGSPMQRDAALWELGLFTAIVGCALFGAVGACRRRRWGAVALIVFYLLSAVAAPSYIPAWLALVIGNTIYFRKRWTMMGPRKEQPLSAAKAQGT